MRYLKIEEGKGYFLNNSQEYIEIDKISKDDILQLLDKAVNVNEKFEMDSMLAEEIKNEAHKIIYKNINEKLLDIVLNREQFTDEISNIYKVALDKYSNKS